MPSVGSLFSGVGGFDLGFEAAGFRVAWQCEIDRDAVSVLERHWPDVPRYGDIATVDPAELAPVDVVIFGSPCQDFSVAGKRAGLDGERSGLFGEAIRIIGGLRPAPALVCWENVPGALSSAGGRDFGAVLDALAGAGALDIAWRILDARWFGVPQRRRRLFVVADTRAERAAEVLFEPQSSAGHPAPSRAAGQGAARDAADGAGGAGEPVVYQCHGNNVGAIGTLRQGNGGLTGGVPFVARGIIARYGKGSPTEADDTLIVDQQNAALVDGVGALTSGLQHHNRGFVVANSATAPAGPAWVRCADGCGDFWCRLHEQHAHDCDCPSVEDWDGDPYADAVAISENQRAEVRETPYTFALANGGGKVGQGYQGVREGMAVRRLTPRECERLMGWPDDATRYRADGSEIPDGPRYRMIGNGVVAPVARWLAARMLAVLEGA